MIIIRNIHGKSIGYRISFMKIIDSAYLISSQAQAE